MQNGQSLRDTKQVRPGLDMPSRLIDVHRWSDHKELNNCLSQLVNEIEGLEKRRRKRTRTQVKRLREAVRAIVLDMFVAWKNNPPHVVAVPLAKGNFGGASRYRALFLQYESFTAAFHNLVDLGYVEIVKKGFKDRRSGKGFVTRARAKEKLIKLLTEKASLKMAAIVSRDVDPAETIIMRDEAKHNIDYTDTSESKRMRADLKRINRKLEKHCIDILVPDRKLKDLFDQDKGQHGRRKQREQCVDFSEKRLVRIFNNERWDNGGRFYGGWWQGVRSKFRKYITIDTKPTVELDYSGLHVAMLYAGKGLKIKGDAYDIGEAGVPREKIKLAFNKLLNATGFVGDKDYNADYRKGKYSLSWRELIQRIKKRHSPIVEFLGTGAGVQLQYKDAEIANRIMLRFLDMGHVCLPIHDSFIVHYALSDELQSIMAIEFQKSVGQKIKIKKMRRMKFPKLKQPYLDMDLTDYLNPTGPYSSYWKRQLEYGL